MGRSRRENIPVPVPVTNTQDPATSGIDHAMSLLQQAHAVFIHEGNNIVGEKERMAELYQEEKDAGAEAQELESCSTGQKGDCYTFMHINIPSATKNCATWYASCIYVAM